MCECIISKKEIIRDQYQVLWEKQSNVNYEIKDEGIASIIVVTELCAFCDLILNSKLA